MADVIFVEADPDRPNPKDEFMKKKKIALEKGCNQGDSNACHGLGEWHQMKKLFTEAQQIYKENCYQRHHGGSCFNLGFLHCEQQMTIVQHDNKD